MRALYPVCQVAELAAGYRYTTGRRSERRLPCVALQGRQTAAASGRQGERLPSGAHPRGLPGHGKPSTASRSAAHSPASQRPIEQHSAAAWQGSGGASPPGYAPDYASSARRERAVLPAQCLRPTSTDGQDRTPPRGAVTGQRTTMMLASPCVDWRAPVWTRPALRCNPGSCPSASLQRESPVVWERIATGVSGAVRGGAGSSM